MSILRRIYDDFELAVCATVMAVGSARILEDALNIYTNKIFTFTSGSFATPVIAACAVVAVDNEETNDRDLTHIVHVAVPTIIGTMAGFPASHSTSACVAAFTAACLAQWHRRYTMPAPRIGSNDFDL